MIRLTEEEKAMLDGSRGRLVRAAMENTVRYGRVLGAQDLCRITRATVFCGAHHYLEVCGDATPAEVFSRMNLGLDDALPFDRVDSGCHVQSCVAPCDGQAWEPFGQTKSFFLKNSAFLEEAARAGVTIAGTCAPYLTGWLPVRGEHFVTTESGVTMTGNSLWGAMANSDGIEAAFWAAICGRTPRWGMHLPENRRGTVLVKVEASPETVMDWDLLGAALGRELASGAVPVVEGDFQRPDFNRLRQFFTSLAVNSNSELCHIPGLTPEAPTVAEAFAGKVPAQALVITEQEMTRVYEETCAAGNSPVTLVSLGCPHYDIHQIREVVRMLGQRKIHPGVTFMVWTAYPVKAMADENGLTRAIEAAGGHIYTSTCPVTVGSSLLDRHDAMVFDSIKQASSARSAARGRVFAAEPAQCIDAAVHGRWEETMQWKRC